MTRTCFGSICCRRRQLLSRPLAQQQHSQDHLRPTTVASLTPASSTHAIATAMQSGYDSDSAPVPNAVTQGVAPPPRRVKKHIPVPLQSTNHGPVPPPTEPRTPRQRSDSTSAGDHVRHHARTNTGGSGHQTPAMHRARSREHLGLPIVGAPTAPLPPPPSTPPPIPGSVPGSATASPNVSTPSTPNMPNNQTFQASLSPPPPTSPPPRTPSHSANANFTSPPASPAHPTRRVSPLVPSGQQQQQQQSHQGRELVSSPPPPIRRSPLLYESSGLDDEEIDHTKFYDDDMADEDWLVKSPAGGPVGASDNHAPHPQRERASSKLTYTESQLEQIRSNIAHASISGQESAQAPISQQHQSMPAPPQVHHAPQHHRSFSQSSNLSTHQTQPQPSSQNSKSPLAGPMYSFQAGNGSISSLHALDNGTSHSKRISDSSRSLKEGSPLLRAATGAGNANGSTTNLSSTLAAPTAATSTSAGAATNTTTTTVSSAVSSPIPSPAPTPTFVPHPSPKPPMLQTEQHLFQLEHCISYDGSIMES
ncbi:hypothetical protein BGW38_007701 [Lunasporangiospora selenospora]|uniref:Uncharacterized protein n=1 Tax=Lunasporangiospora selenospora TaxID=979761 RepID=A0A9P6FKB8_9FUNG|nr:hypothetical protein BGW38_007701 [Lunasporangiospora selenospora]